MDDAGYVCLGLRIAIYLMVYRDSIASKNDFYKSHKHTATP